MFVQQIKDVIRDIDSRKLEDLVLAKEILGLMAKGFEAGLTDIPEWIIDGINLLSREATNRSRAELERELKKEEARIEALATREDRRVKAAERIVLLKKKLEQ